MIFTLILVQTIIILISIMQRQEWSQYPAGGGDGSGSDVTTMAPQDNDTLENFLESYQDYCENNVRPRQINMREILAQQRREKERLEQERQKTTVTPRKTSPKSSPESSKRSRESQRTDIRPESLRYKVDLNRQSNYKSVYSVHNTSSIDVLDVRKHGEFSRNSQQFNISINRLFESDKDITSDDIRLNSVKNDNILVNSKTSKQFGDRDSVLNNNKTSGTSSQNVISNPSDVVEFGGASLGSSLGQVESNVPVNGPSLEKGADESLGNVLLKKTDEGVASNGDITREQDDRNGQKEFNKESDGRASRRKRFLSENPQQDQVSKRLRKPRLSEKSRYIGRRVLSDTLPSAKKEEEKNVEGESLLDAKVKSVGGVVQYESLKISPGDSIKNSPFNAHSLPKGVVDNDDISTSDISSNSSLILQDRSLNSVKFRLQNKNETSSLGDRHLVGGDGLDLKNDLNFCDCIPNTLIGWQNVSLMESLQIGELELELDEVRPGGIWFPLDCIPRQRVAIIIPFRDREEHLRILLNILHPMLQRQQLHYQIFVIQQLEPAVFNKASLMNSGYKHARATAHFDCYIFHDVDMLPEDDRNFYTCSHVPRHIGSHIDKWNYIVPYQGIFGGVTGFRPHHFELVNGFSNQYYGWGGEDDDMFARIRAKNLTVVRFSKTVTRYSMIRHKSDAGNPYNVRSNVAWKFRPRQYEADGLNSLRYKIVTVEDRPLYTWMLVTLPPHPSYFRPHQRGGGATAAGGISVYRPHPTIYYILLLDIVILLQLLVQRDVLFKCCK